MGENLKQNKMAKEEDVRWLNTVTHELTWRRGRYVVVDLLGWKLRELLGEEAYDRKIRTLSCEGDTPLHLVFSKKEAICEIESINIKLKELRSEIKRLEELGVSLCKELEVKIEKYEGFYKE